MSSSAELAVFSALEARLTFFLRRQEESKQRRRRPWVGAGLRPVPCATRQAGRLRNSGLRPSNSPRRLPPAFLRCSAPPKGPGKPSVAGEGFFDFGHFFGPTVAFLFSDAARSRNAFRVPLRGAEQRRRAGGLRRGLFEGRSPEFRSRPACRVAQGTGVAGADPGVAFSLATFFWRSKRKYARQQGGNPSLSKPPAGRNRTVAQNHPQGATP